MCEFLNARKGLIKKDKNWVEEQLSTKQQKKDIATTPKAQTLEEILYKPKEKKENQIRFPRLFSLLALFLLYVIILA